MNLLSEMIFLLTSPSRRRESAVSIPFMPKGALSNSTSLDGSFYLAVIHYPGFNFFYHKMTPDLGGRFCSFFEKKFILSLKNYLVFNTIEIFPLKSKVYGEKTQ